MNRTVVTIFMLLSVVLLIAPSGYAAAPAITESELRSIMSEYQDSIDKSLLELQRTTNDKNTENMNTMSGWFKELDSNVMEKIKMQELKIISMFTAFGLVFIGAIGLVWSYLVGKKWYAFRRDKKQMYKDHEEDLVRLAAKKHAKEMKKDAVRQILLKYNEYIASNPEEFAKEHPEITKTLCSTILTKEEIKKKNQKDPMSERLKKLLDKMEEE